MKLNRAAQLITAATLAGFGLMSSSPALAVEHGDEENHTNYYDLDDGYDLYVEYATEAGGEENLSDQQIEEIIIKSLY